jgi:hypothetical protein
MTQYQPQQRGNGPFTGNAPMTWQGVLIVLLAFPLLVSLIYSIVGMIRPSTWSPAEQAFADRWAWPITGVIFAATAAMIFLHLRRSRRPDLAHDFLGTFFNAATIYQAGPVHTVVVGMVKENIVRVMALAQNRYDREAEFRLHAGRNNRHLICIKVPPSGVTLSCVDIPLASCYRSGAFCVQLFPSGGGGGGKMVRFASRIAPTTDSHEMMLTIVQLAAGHVTIPLGTTKRGPVANQGLYALGQRSKLEIPVPDAAELPPGPGIDSCLDRLRPATKVIWAPGQAVSMEDFTTELAAAITAPVVDLDVVTGAAEKAK